MFDLKDRVALVTGAGQGVGAGISLALAKQGARVAVNDLVGERAEGTVVTIAGSGGRAVASAFDVADYDAAERAIRGAEAELGPIDILVNNAGIPAGMSVRPFRETLPSDWRPYVDINLYGVMNCCRVVIEGMCQRGHGRIITISSGAGTVGLGIGVSPYAAGKGGGISFMRHLAMENAAHGVTANTLAIGLMHNESNPALGAQLAATIPVGRVGEPSDIAAACIYVASDEASWLTGQTIELNGGSVTT
jgi:3-oxoacyl-[acyl-carrier protein] reductase